MNIYTPIAPTYLYIKQHSVTGLKYFGKTTKDPYKYNGSGKHWTSHIKKHSKEHIVTLWVSNLYHDTSIVNVALALSEMFDIVDSGSWANLVKENGLDGAISGRKYTVEQRKKCSDRHWAKGLARDLNPNTGSKRSEESKSNISKSKLGLPNLKLRGKIPSNDTRRLWSNIRKGKTINIKEDRKIKLLELYSNVLSLFESKPKLEIPYNYIAKNGKWFSYENAFAKVYCETFNVSSRTISNIIRKTQLLQNEL
jgi:hypothetical protein